MRFRGLRTPAIVCGCVLGIVGIAVAYSATLPSAPADRARPAHPVSAASGPSELRAQAAAARESQLNEARWSRASKKAHATDTPLIDSCTGKPMSGPYHFITSKAECRAPKSTSGARPARTPAIPPDSFAGRLTPAQWKRAND